MENSEQIIKQLKEQNQQLCKTLSEINAVLSISVLFLGELIKTFQSHDDFMSFDKSILKQFYDKDDRIICLDKNGNCCNIIIDFETANNRNNYPIKVYRLIRTSDVKI